MLTGWGRTMGVVSMVQYHSLYDLGYIKLSSLLISFRAILVVLLSNKTQDDHAHRMIKLFEYCYSAEYTRVWTIIRLRTIIWLQGGVIKNSGAYRSANNTTDVCGGPRLVWFTSVTGNEYVKVSGAIVQFKTQILEFSALGPRSYRLERLFPPKKTVHFCKILI